MVAKRATEILKVVISNPKTHSSSDVYSILSLLRKMTSQKFAFKSKNATLCLVALLFTQTLETIKCSRKYIALINDFLLNLSRFHLKDENLQKAIVGVMAKWLDTNKEDCKLGSKLHLAKKYQLALRFIQSDHKERIPVFVTILLKAVKHKVRTVGKLAQEFKNQLWQGMNFQADSPQMRMITKILASMQPATLVNSGLEDLARQFSTREVKDAWISKLSQQDSDPESLRWLIESEAQWILENPQDPKVQSLLKSAREKLLDQYAKINYITKRVIPIENFKLIQKETDFEKCGQKLPVEDIFTQQFTYARKRNIIISVSPDKDTMEFFKPKGSDSLPEALIKTLETNIKKTWEKQAMVQVSTIVEPNGLLSCMKYGETGPVSEVYTYDGLLNPKPALTWNQTVSAIAQIQNQKDSKSYRVLGLFGGQVFKVINPKTRKVLANFTQEQMQIYKMFQSKSDREAFIPTREYGTCLIPGDDSTKHVFSLRLRKVIDTVDFPYTGSWSCYVKKGGKIYLYSYSKVRIYEEATLKLIEVKETMIATPAICFILDEDRIGIFEEKWPILIIHDLRTHNFTGYSLHNDLNNCYDVSDIGPLPPLIHESANRLSVGIKNQDCTEAWMVSLDLTEFK